jgi:hypothetical protein
MASPYLTEQAGLIQSPEIVGLERQRKLADLLTSQAFQSPQGQMISGQYVKPATTQQLQPLLSALLATGMNKNLDERQTELAAALRGKQAQDIQRYAELQKTNPSEALQFALSSNNPTLKSLAQDELKGHILPEGATYQRANIATGQMQPVGQSNPKQTETMRNYNLAKEQGFPGSLIDYELALKRAGATNVNVSTEKSYGQHLAEGFSKKDVALSDAAESSVNSIRNIQNQKQILNSGKFFSGPTANVQQALASYGNALGVGGKDSNELAANTQSLISGGAKITLDNIKSSGLGAGQGFTDKDLQFLQDAQSYKVIWNKESIDRVLTLQEKAAKANIDKWNNRLQDIPKSASGPLGIRPIQTPTYNTQPAGNPAPARSNVVNEALSIIQGK